jgi:predicted phage terminase large subunit-like protein
LLTSDYVVGQVWARRGSYFLLGDQVRARMDCPATVRAVRGLSAKWPATFAKLIEDKANGSAVIQMLSQEIPGLLPVNPMGGKVARAAAVSPLVEAGNVFLPHPLFAPWVDDFIEECVAFPNGAHDDQVDAMTQALLRFNTPQPQRMVYISPEEYDRLSQISPI